MGIKWYVGMWEEGGRGCTQPASTDGPRPRNSEGVRRCAQAVSWRACWARRNPGFLYPRRPVFFLWETIQIIFLKVFWDRSVCVFYLPCAVFEILFVSDFILFGFKENQWQWKNDRLKTVTRKFNPNNKKQIFLQEELGKKKKKTCTSWLEKDGIGN